MRFGRRSVAAAAASPQSEVGRRPIPVKQAALWSGPRREKRLVDLWATHLFYVVEVVAASRARCRPVRNSVLQA